MRSVELRFFAGKPERGVFNAKTPTTGNPAFLGSLGLFGMTLPDEKMPKGMGRRGEMNDLQLDITKALRKSMKRKRKLLLTVVPVSAEGKSIKPRELKEMWKPPVSFELVVA